jgi:ABC-type arginine transport system ATPase subunit
MSDIKIKSKNLNVFYGEKQALFDVNLDLNEKEGNSSSLVHQVVGSLHLFDV